MKTYHTLLYIYAIAMTMAMTACNGNKTENTGKKFNPTERTSSMTDSQREEALAAKRAALEVNIDSILYSHGVRFAIVEPKTGGDITQDIANRISMKMLQIASQNGISGVGSYNFVLGTEIAQTGRTATGTAPQKMTVNYELTFKVMNTLTGDVYATAVQEVMGVGNSFAEANQNAVKGIKNTPKMQKMLQTASQRIVSWYNDNLQVIKNQVEKAEGEGDYALALAILNSIPDMHIIETAQANAARVLVPMIVQMGYREEDITVAYRKDFKSFDISRFIEVKSGK